MNKKGFFFAIPIAILVSIYMLLAVLILVFGWKLIAFIITYWWAVLGAIVLILFHQQIRAIINAILGRFGIKV